MNWQGMLFQDWQGVVRTLFVGVLAYIALVAILRISGKRTLAKLNAFDLVVTVALGSTLSAILLQESIALAEGVVALALLIGMQFLVAFLSVRSQAFAKAVRSSRRSWRARVRSATPPSARSGSRETRRSRPSGPMAAAASRTSTSLSSKATGP